MRSRRNRIGSNQFQIKQRSHWKYWLLVYFTGILAFMVFAQYYKNEGMEIAYANSPIVRPVPDNFNIEIEAEKVVEPETEQIKAYIKEVFGKHSEKAFKVLSCENSRLDPYAVNTAGNVPEGSRDTGVFQINEHWQQVQYKFLLNWKVNIQIAYQIFEDNGYSFERWSCGRRFGI